MCPPARPKAWTAAGSCSECPCWTNFTGWRRPRWAGCWARVLTVSTKGIEFVMTALFVTIFTGQWMEDREHRPALVGLGASVLCLALFGAGNFILPAMALIVLLLLVMRPALDKKGAVR